MKSTLISRFTRIAIMLGLAVIVSAPFPVRAEDGKKAGASNADRAAWREKIHSRILEKFDANHNGKLDPGEREAARKAFRERFGKGGKFGHGEWKHRKPGTDDSAVKPAQQ
jgi:hypothetical protein